MLTATSSSERQDLPRGERHDPVPTPIPRAATHPGARSGMAIVLPLAPATSPDAALLRDVVSAAESDGCRPVHARVDRHANQVAITIQFGTPWRTDAAHGTTVCRVSELARTYSAAISCAVSCSEGLVSVSLLIPARRR